MLRTFFVPVSRYTYLMVVLFLIFISTSAALAQKDLTFAARESLQLGDLGKARQQVEALLLNPKLVSDAKVWHLKGWIYKELYVKYPTHDKDSLYREQSLQALAQSIKLDTGKKFKKENLKIAVFVANSFFNDGKKAFDNKQYNEAADYFISYLKQIKQIDAGGQDVNATFYAGYNAWLGGEKQKAEEYLKQAIALPQPQPLAYVALSKLKLSDADTLGSYELIEKAAKLFPQSKDVAITRANLYLLSKRYAEALPLLESALALDSTNAELLVATASTLEKLAEDDSTKEAQLQKAAHYYQQALVIEPDNFLANYNLGTIIYNRGIAQTKPVTRSPKVNMLLLKKEGEDNSTTFKQALPLLEKASALNPTHKEALVALETIYFNLNQTENYNKVKAKLAQMQQEQTVEVKANK